MSWGILAQAKRSRTGGGLRKVVLLYLAERADDSGIAFYKVKDLAGDAEVSERECHRALAALETQGHVTIHQRPGRSSVYRVHPIQPTHAQQAEVESAASPNAAGAEISDSRMAAQGGQPESLPLDAPVQPSSESAADPGTEDSKTSAYQAEVTSEACGSIVHSPACQADRSAQQADPPLPDGQGGMTNRQTGLPNRHNAKILSSPSFSPFKNSLSSPGAPDDLKKSWGEQQNGKPPSAEEFEQRRQKQLADCERAMRDKAAAGGARA